MQTHGELAHVTLTVRHFGDLPHDSYDAWKLDERFCIDMYRYPRPSTPACSYIQSSDLPHERDNSVQCNKASTAVCGVPAAVQRHTEPLRSLGTRGHSCVIDAFAHGFDAECDHDILLVLFYLGPASRCVQSLLAFTGRDQQVCCNREGSSGMYMCYNMWSYLYRFELRSHPFAAPSVISSSSNSMSCAPAVRLHVHVPFPPL